MINRLPRWLPTFAELIEDLGLRPETHPAVARALGVSERTIRRWIAGKAPRVARLSLWWLSRYGYSEWACEMERRAYFPAAMARAVVDEARRASAPKPPQHPGEQDEDRNRSGAAPDAPPLKCMLRTLRVHRA